MLLDRGLELLNVLGPPLSEGCLSLAIPLLPLLGRCIYLAPNERLLPELEQVYPPASVLLSSSALEQPLAHTLPAHQTRVRSRRTNLLQVLRFWGEVQGAHLAST